MLYWCEINLKKTLLRLIFDFDQSISVVCMVEILMSSLLIINSNMLCRA